MKKFISILILCFTLNFAVLNSQQILTASTQACLFPNITDILSVTAGEIKSFTKTFSLTKGFYQLSFTLAPMFMDVFSDPNLKISFNGQLVQTIDISTSLPQTYTIAVNAITGCNLLTFQKPIVQMFPYLIFFFSIQINYKPCVSTSSSNLVVNGDFQSTTHPKCRGYNSFCILFNSTYNPASVTAWIPDPQMQLAHGHIYNRRLPDTIVTQLDPNRNTCIKQKIQNFKAGKYAIQFIWAARTSVRPLSSSFSVKMNDQIVKQFAPTDYTLKTQRIEFSVATALTQNWLRFCGGGASDGNGVLIDNVKLFYLDGCTTV